jgi:tetratricopeptide (TPR) repeat protein
LRHRADVRKVMLNLLAADDPEKVASIHERAVEYYRKERGTRARAEEIYHRLMLQQSSAEIDKRWRDELQSYLAPSYEELPSISRAYLATKLGYEIDDATRKAVDTAVWERAAVAKAQDLLALDKPKQALDVLRERKERSASGLVYELEVQALHALGNFKEAVDVVENALPSMRTAAGAVRFLALAEAGAEYAQITNDLPRAIALLETAASMARASADPVTRLRIATELFALRNEVSLAPRSAEADQLVTLYRNTPNGDLLANDSVVFNAATILADRLPASLLNAIELSHKANWTRRLISKLKQAVQRMPTRMPVKESTVDELEGLRSAPLRQRGRAVRRLLSRLTAVTLPTGEVARELARIIQDASIEPIDSEGDDTPATTLPTRRSRAALRPRSSTRRRLK